MCEPVTAENAVSAGLPFTKRLEKSASEKVALMQQHLMNSSLAISQVSKGRQESKRYCDEVQDKSYDEMEVPVPMYPNTSVNRTKDEPEESCNYTKTSAEERPEPSPHRNMGDGLLAAPQTA